MRSIEVIEEEDHIIHFIIDGKRAWIRISPELITDFIRLSTKTTEGVVDTIMRELDVDFDLTEEELSSYTKIIKDYISKYENKN